MSTLLLPSDPHDAAQDWLAAHDQRRLLDTIRQALSRARATGHAVVASYSRSIPAHDLLPLFTATTASEAFYWEQPTREVASAGLGVAYRIMVNGSASMLSAAMHWRALLSDAACYQDGTADDGDQPLSGPVCFGGFAFDPHMPHTSLWEGFPGGMLCLPKTVVSVARGKAKLTLNALVSADDLPEDVAEGLISSALRVRLAGLRVDAQDQDNRDLSDALAAPSVALTELRSRQEWMRLVGEATEEIRRGAYHKIVLARGVQVECAGAGLNDAFDGEANLRATLGRLRRSDPNATVFAIRRGRRVFLGATPEQLAQVTAGRLRTMALAGTTRRGATPAEDERLAHDLLASAKNREEHAIVVASITEALRPLCQRLDIADAPQIITLATVQHLLTPITGVVAESVSALDVAAALHPTPAVGGFPRQAALTAIRTHEGLDRGWYAGPVGWLGPQGDGEFVLALRSALLVGNRATLFAGCGVVADSDPQSEYAESQIKLRVMLRGLGLNE